VKRVSLIAALVAAAVAVIVACLWGFAVAREWFAPTQGWDQPLSRDAAIQRTVIDYSFPASARDIYECTRNVGTQENPSFVRFTVDPSEVDAHIRDIVRRYRWGLQPTTPRKTAVENRTLRRPGWLPPPPRWWRVADIQHGYAVTFGRDIWLTFWYDSDRHILYCYDVS
jgi:hypothetical protein